MDALILADGDRPTRDELDTTWPGWDSGVGLVVAVRYFRWEPRR